MTQKHDVKKGVHMHPFSDQSGIGFFDPSSTIVTTVKVSEASFNAFMNGDVDIKNANDEQQVLYNTVISSLSNQGFIEKVLAEK